MELKPVIKSKRKPTGAAALGAGPGRPKGLGNKNAAALKDMILTALHNAGGADYLEQRANDPRTASAFLSLIGKVLPMQVTGPGDGPLEARITIEYVRPNPTP